MKTLKIFAILSLALIFNGVNAVYSRTNNNTEKGIVPGVITYQVNIHAPNYPVISSEQVYVVMTDENGNPVARPQVFKTGTWVYTFNEAGPVKGARIARLELSGGRTFNEYPYPDIQKGIFLNGESYMFNLYPVNQIIEDRKLER